MTTMTVLVVCIVAQPHGGSYPYMHMPTSPSYLPLQLPFDWGNVVCSWYWDSKILHPTYWLWYWRSSHICNRLQCQLPCRCWPTTSKPIKYNDPRLHWCMQCHSGDGNLPTLPHQQDQQSTFYEHIARQIKAKLDRIDKVSLECMVKAKKVTEN